MLKCLVQWCNELDGFRTDKVLRMKEEIWRAFGYIVKAHEQFM
jgi:hypothetical protein